MHVRGSAWLTALSFVVGAATLGLGCTYRGRHDGHSEGRRPSRVDDDAGVFTPVGWNDEDGTLGGASAGTVVDPECAPGSPCACGLTRRGVCEAGSPRAQCVCPPEPPVPCALDVDWLFVVDDSHSMEEEQAALAREIPRLVEILVTGDGNGDGVEDFTPVRSVHLGIVTTDLGAGEHLDVPTCARGWGGDARLRRGVQISASCAGLELSDGIFSFGTDDDADARIAFADDFACAARAGLGGCGFEQPLEATLRALAPSEPTSWTSPSYEPIVFRDGSSGHGLGANAGFLREDSVLAITLLSDEEDCSTPDTSLYVSGDPRFMSVPFNLRCDVFAELRYPTERYVRGLASLRPDPRLLVFSAITGVPPGTYVTAAQYEQLLRDPRMEARANEMGSAVAPVCESEHGTAAPARRTLLVAADLQRSGALTSVSSICSRSYESAVSDIVRTLVRARASCR